MVLDVSNGGSVEACFKDVEAREGTPTILVNNAGVTRDGLLMRMSAEDWQTVIETDLSSVYRTCKAVMRGMMKARRGRIINIASVVGGDGQCRPDQLCRRQGRHDRLLKSLAREVGSRGITVNVVAPGFIVTDMTDALGEEQPQGAAGPGSPRPAGLAGGRCPRRGLPGITQAGYITGETLHVNGGMYMI